MRWTRYNVTPVTKPRQTRSDKWKKRPCVLRYREFADQVRAAGVTVENGDWITFHMPMPQTWPLKKRLSMLGAPHQSTPDIDNLTKSVLDALHENDAHIWHLGTIMKRWSDVGGISIGRPETNEHAETEPTNETET